LKAILSAKTHARTPTLDLAVEEMWVQSAAFIRNCAYKKPALVVRQLVKGGAAAKAGVAEWHLITSLNGIPHGTVNTFMKKIRSLNPGDKVTLGMCERDGTKPRQTTVTLGHLEAAWVK